MEIRLNVARNLLLLRKANGLTQAELAEKIGYTQTAVAAWESGRNTPRLGDLIALKTLYNITLEDLIM